METMDCYLYRGLGGVTYQWASSRLFIPRGDNVSSPGGGGGLLGMLGGGVPRGSSNPDPIWDQKM